VKEDWKDQARCKGMPSDLFFGVADEPSQEMLDLCHSCPSFIACYDHAMKHEEYGYWAGTTAKKRRKLRREQGRPMEPLVRSRMPVKGCGTNAGYARHLHRKEPACAECVREHRAYNAEKAARKRANRKARIGL